MTRLLSAVALAALALAVLFLTPPAGFFWLVFFLALRAAWEYQELVIGCGWPLRRWDVPVDAGALILATRTGGIFPGLILTVIMLRLLVRALSAESPREGIARAGVSLLGAIWIGGAASLVAALRALPGGTRAVLFLFLAVWASDIAAYGTGRCVGRRPLAPRLSPGKTVEGAAGGLLAAGAVGVLLPLGPGASALGALAAGSAGALIGALAQLGDLCESALKRAAGVKDASSLIPGHGGLLDRIDGLLLAAPPFYYFVYWTTHI